MFTFLGRLSFYAFLNKESVQKYLIRQIAIRLDTLNGRWKKYITSADVAPFISLRNFHLTVAPELKSVNCKNLYDGPASKMSSNGIIIAIAPSHPLIIAFQRLPL